MKKSLSVLIGLVLACFLFVGVGNAENMIHKKRGFKKISTKNLCLEFVGINQSEETKKMVATLLEKMGIQIVSGSECFLVAISFVTIKHQEHLLVTSVGFQIEYKGQPLYLDLEYYPEPVTRKEAAYDLEKKFAMVIVKR